MDIAGLSTALANMEVQSAVSVAVLSKALDTNAALGGGVVDMISSQAMELSVNPDIGANLDIRV